MELMHQDLCGQGDRHQHNKDKNMKQNYFTYLPSKLVTDILARLPVQTILSCKCVCKGWHDLIETQEFVEFHFCKSVPELALIIIKPNAIDKFIELTNVLYINDHTFPNLNFNTIVKLNFTRDATIEGSAGGLLLLRMPGTKLHLYNPITREYIDLLHSHPRFHPFYPKFFGIPIYGFGVSKITGQYKAVSIFHDQSKNTRTLPEPECKVYTIGTGLWRTVAPDVTVRYNISVPGIFVNGNLHWLAKDLNDNLWISCFDLETELFSTFSPPPNLYVTCHELLGVRYNASLWAVEDTLCLCDHTDYDIIVWMMKECGVEETWTKYFVIDICPDLWCIEVFPIRISKDGAILMTYKSDSVFYYSNKNKTTNKICSSGGYLYMTPHSYTPSLLSLKCFRMENSISF